MAFDLCFATELHKNILYILRMTNLFPILQHFFASIEKAQRELGWTPEFGLVDGLADSYNLDFGRGTFRKAADFSTDDIILGKSLVLQT